jgi:hypothetical protein
MTEENFSPQESLRLIQSMITKTKQDISESSIHFLVWGWITLIACTGQFVLKHIFNYEKHYMVWLLTIVGIIFSNWYSFKERKTRKVKTYIGDSINHLWIGMAIAYLVLSIILTVIGWNSPVFPFFILLYGLGSFISGSIIQFRPLVIGGIVAFILAIASVFAEYDYQMLFGAAAILFSYIIPAYLLRAKNKQSNE